MSVWVSSCRKYIPDIKKKRKAKNEKGIISREGLTAFLFWSLLHMKPEYDYSQIVLSGNRYQIHQHLLLLFFLLLNVLLTLFFPFFVGVGAGKRDGVYLILLCWHTRLGSDKRASGAVLIQISACSQ